MNRAFQIFLLATSASFATVPVAFTSGTPAKADDVNKNFAALDSAIQKKADASLVSVLQTAVAGKADQSYADSKLAGKADTNTVRTIRDSIQKALAGKADSAWVRSHYLPVLGGTLTGNLSAANANFTGTVTIGGQNLVLNGSGSGNYTGTWLYAFPASNPAEQGLYFDLPRLSNEPTGTPSNFTINYRGGTWQLLKYDGKADLLTISRPTKINNTLTVTGPIKTAAGAIKSSDVADYVFEPDYRLAPLSEIEAYTKEHKHLPEVPSATEIEQGGLDLAKMNLLLLKKVEELTLHTIELEKRMKAFEAAQKP